MAGTTARAPEPHAPSPTGAPSFPRTFSSSSTSPDLSARSMRITSS
eukprot:CAMPEP_0206055458 /NCGR_PEP_ID=MMETSP1466-20131121/40169_1 /ASSEMBLY_ACC=CAM_ASM_001126 /TAXON_ID=44452 /ORGANISM="Pavlova gyrans, Strain CCMP608" /LENGTH=45 /DNA_ID= /DNA_START= /DNA_END= /DNA_ORIENTATION=